MSYDLYFKPRSGALESKAFGRYFEKLPHFKVDLPQACYQNDDTGVYFVFELNSEESEDEADPQYPVSLNINYFRPSYFALEAEPVVTAFVRHFDLLVSDPQTHGMGDGDYDADRFLAGWNQGNAFGHSAILRDPANRPDVVSLPNAVLLRSWKWNLARESLQQTLGETKFVPKVMFLVIDGQPATAATWPDGIPIAVPEVDYLIVPRKEFAPRKLFRRVEDTTVLKYQDALTLLEKHRDPSLPGLVLGYEVTPPDVASFVEALPKSSLRIQGVAPDSMLDRELVELTV
jgi:hypothetical protein